MAGEATVTLDAFELRELAGRGAMGEVWRAWYVAERLDVAIKLVSSADAASPRLRASLDAEVRAIARLHHPNVVALYEIGAVPSDAGGALARYAGSPYLAMGWCDGGTLDAAAVGSWAEARAVLGDVLAALAHAHARGVVHRDVKPANILRRGTRWVLGDFGIARLIGREGEAQAAGTPMYLAPEQARGSWWLQGPPTDLYGLGCVAWHLVTGRPPFVGGASQVVWAHLQDPLPPLRPRFPVPARLEEWLERLLRKWPSDRFGLAAEAMHALEALGEPEGPWAASRAPRLPLAAADTFVVDVGAPPDAASTDGRVASPALHGAGLGLFASRVLPLVGREREREQLWTELLRVRDERTVSVVVISGPPGSGKSRLADWLCEEAHEVGVASSLALNLTGSAGEGLVDLVPTLLGAPPPARVEHADALIQSRPGRFSLGEVERWLRGDGDAAERHRMARLLLGEVAEARAVVLKIEGVLGVREVLESVVRFLRSADLPLLVVLPVEDPGDPRLAGLQRVGRVVRVELEPLTPLDTRRIVSGLLGLGGSLAERVARGSCGNPGYAVDLLRHWIAVGVLAPTPEGLVLAGAEPPLPDGLADVWRDRVRASFPATPPLAVQVAAMLGGAVDAQVWAAACRELGIAGDDDLVERLVRGRLATRTTRGFAFSHPLVPELLSPTDPELARSVHLACARGGDDPADAARIGRHFLAAGRPDDAAERLFTGLMLAINHGDLVVARDLLRVRASAIAGSSNPHHLVSQALGEARCLLALRRMREASAHVATLEAGLADRSLSGRVADRAVLAVAQYHDLQGDTARALAVLDAHLALAGPDDRSESQVVVRLVLARLERGRGRLDRARQLLDEAEAFDPRPLQRALVLEGRGQLARLAGDVDGAQAAFQRLAEVAEANGGADLVVQAKLGLAECWRLRGDLDRAELGYLDVMALTRLLGGTTVTVRANLGLVRMAAGRFDGARALLEGLIADVARAGQSRLQRMLEANLLACALALGDLETFDALAPAVARGLDEAGVSEPDVAWPLELAAERARPTAPERAAVAMDIARRQRAGLPER